MKQKTWTPETLQTRVCKRGHSGNWVVRPNNNIACRDCVAISMAKHRAANPVKGVGTVPKLGQINKLKEHIEKLETALEVAKKKLEVSLELQRLDQELKKLKGR